LPGAEYDGKTIISYKEAMSLPKQPKSMLIIGAGPIGLEFGYFYNAIGTKVTVVELLDRILPGEDEEGLEGAGAEPHEARADDPHELEDGKVEKTSSGVKVAVETPAGPKTIEAELMLVSIGVLGTSRGSSPDNLKVAIEKNHIKVDPKNGYVTSVPGIYGRRRRDWSPWLAHVAHHEAICCIERSRPRRPHGRLHDDPGCTYTDPGVASVGLTEKAARAAGHEVRIGKFPFLASGRALASDETEGLSNSSSTPSTASFWAPTYLARRPPS